MLRILQSPTYESFDSTTPLRCSEMLHSKLRMPFRQVFKIFGNGAPPTTLEGYDMITMELRHSELLFFYM